MNPRFNCELFQEFVKQGEKRCYARVYFPRIVNTTRPGGDSQPIFEYPCEDGTSVLRVTKPNNALRKPKNRFKLLAKGNANIKSDRILPLVNVINNDPTKDIYLHPYLLISNLKNLKIRINLLEYRPQTKDSVYSDLRKYANLYIPNKKQTGWLFTTIPAEFGFQYGNKASLNLCLNKLYKTAGPFPPKEKFNTSTKGKYWIVIHFFLPGDIYDAITGKKEKIEFEDQEVDAVHRFNLPQNAPEEAIEWANNLKVEFGSESKAFKLENDKWDRELIVWRSKDRIASFTTKIETESYWRTKIENKECDPNYFCFDHPFSDDEDVLAIVIYTQKLWNSDMKFFVMENGEHPDTAARIVHKNSELYLKAVFSYATGILGGAWSAKAWPSAPSKQFFTANTRNGKIQVKTIRSQGFNSNAKNLLSTTAGFTGFMSWFYNNKDNVNKYIQEDKVKKAREEWKREHLK